MVKEKLDRLVKDPVFLAELEKAYQRAKETSDYFTRASKVSWKDLHKPMTI